MVIEMNAVLQSVRVLNDLVQASRTFRNFNELSSAVVEVNTKLSAAISVALTAQQQQMVLSQRVSDLEKEIIELKNWDREAERYELASFTPGIFAYRLKPGMENHEPPHHLCAHCFTNNEKSILYVETSLGGDCMVRCLRCQSVLVLR